MNRIKNFVTIAAFSLLVLGIPAIASAQYYPDNDRNNDRYGNGRYGNDDRYGDYGRNSRGTLRALKQHARQFERILDRDLDRGRYDGTYREDSINELADRFTNAVRNLSESDIHDRRDSEVRNVTNLASQLDRAISRARVSSQVQNHWSLIRNDMRQLGLSYGYRNGRGRNNNRNNVPSWWPF